MGLVLWRGGSAAWLEILFKGNWTDITGSVEVLGSAMNELIMNGRMNNRSQKGAPSLRVAGHSGKFSQAEKVTRGFSVCLSVCLCDSMELKGTLAAVPMNFWGTQRPEYLKTPNQR